MSLLDGHMSWDILFDIFNIPVRPLCLSQFECVHVIYAIKGSLTFLISSAHCLAVLTGTYSGCLLVQ